MSTTSGCNDIVIRKSVVVTTLYKSSIGKPVSWIVYGKCVDRNQHFCSEILFYKIIYCRRPKKKILGFVIFALFEEILKYNWITEFLCLADNVFVLLGI